MKNVHWQGMVRAFMFLLGAVIALLPALSVSAAWSPEQESDWRISPDPTDPDNPIEARTPAIAAAGNVVYVVWSGDVLDGNTGERTGDSQIQLRRSFNGGNTFEALPFLPVSGGTGNATDPAIAVNGSNVYIVWTEDDVPSNEGNPEICFAFSNNGGNAFKKRSKSFKNEAAVPEPCRNPITEGTKVFNLNFNLSNTPKADSICPSIAVSGSNIFVAWSELAKDGFQIVLAQSTNGGNSFAKGKVVSKTLSGGKEADALCPKLAVSSSTLYGVWMEDSLGNFEIAFRQLTGKCTITVGKQGECPVINLSNSERDSVDPVIAVNGRNIYVAWADKTDGDFDIYLTTSHDGGKTFSEPINVSDDDVDSLKPALAVEGTRVYLAWVSYEDNQGQIKFVRSSNSGVDFDHEEVLSNPRTNARHPALAANASKVFLTWADDIDADLDVGFEDFAGISAIFFRFSDASGLVFPETSVSSAPSASRIVAAQALVNEPGAVRFVAQGADVAAVKVEVFSLTGRLVYASDFTDGNVLHWNGLSNAGQPLANGVYIYVLTAKARNGDVVRTKVQKLVILR